MITCIAQSAVVVLAGLLFYLHLQETGDKLDAGAITNELPVN